MWTWEEDERMRGAQETGVFQSACSRSFGSSRMEMGALLHTPPPVQAPVPRVTHFQSSRYRQHQEYAAMRHGQPIVQAQMPQKAPIPPSTPLCHYSPRAVGVKVPDSRQRKRSIRSFDGKKPMQYEGLDSGFLDRGHRCVRQLVLAQMECGFDWSEEVKANLLRHYLIGNAERYYHKQLATWWQQQPMLQYVMDVCTRLFEPLSLKLKQPSY
ncbi:unnamed protein product [Albugo candida]|uniref:Uncharacterized protein n=1 Tax=Albugo candida TaxID=65357 RepID=A0A024FT58_9STRA|nr:unnamed protein product [Albugo candida]|eukprot:CCI10057.1 unnamed protein product [Albugo candida]